MEAGGGDSGQEGGKAIYSRLSTLQSISVNCVRRRRQQSAVPGLTGVAERLWRHLVQRILNDSATVWEIGLFFGVGRHGAQGRSDGGIWRIYTPKISPSELLWDRNDVTTPIEHEY